MIMIAWGFRHTEIIDPSDKGLSVKIPTSSVSIAATCVYL